MTATPINDVSDQFYHHAMQWPVEESELIIHLGSRHLDRKFWIFHFSFPAFSLSPPIPAQWQWSEAGEDWGKMEVNLDRSVNNEHEVLVLLNFYSNPKKAVIGPMAQIYTTIFFYARHTSKKILFVSFKHNSLCDQVYICLNWVLYAWVKLTVLMFDSSMRMLE